MFWSVCTLFCFFHFRLCTEGKGKVSISALAAKYHIPKTTLRKHLTGKVVGKGHQSGGRGAPHVLSSGKSNCVDVDLHVFLKQYPKHQVCTSNNWYVIIVLLQMIKKNSQSCWSISASLSFPLSKNKLHRLAWEYADMNGLTGFSPRKEKAGQKWLKGFLK